jgi:methionine-rich copper-binding protein CopC
VIVATFAANPDKEEVDEFPPVSAPVVEMFPEEYEMSFPERVQLLFTRIQVGEAEVPELT